jgi:hypothetical protein
MICGAIIAALLVFPAGVLLGAALDWLVTPRLPR